MMKKFLLFLLLFVNLQIVMHEDEVVLDAGMEAAAQVMATEQYTCWDDIGKSWYSSSMSCDFDGGINIHECSYCKKTHESDEARLAHEKVCPKRPKRGGGGSTGPGNTGGGFSGYDLDGDDDKETPGRTQNGNDGTDRKNNSNENKPSEPQPTTIIVERVISPKDLEDMQNAAIKKLLDDFLKSQKETMYPEMEKNRVVQRINELVANPWKITQGKNGTCGAAVICKYLLKKDPVTFVKAVLGIIQNGKYSPWGLTADPDSYGFSGFDGSKSIALDQIIQGAMVNSMNMLFDYNPAEDGSGIYSFVWPRSLKNFLEMVGANVKEISYQDISKHPEVLKDYFVIGLAALDQNNGYCTLPYKNPVNLEYMHYFQITDITANGGFTFWSWGQKEDKYKSDYSNPNFYDIWAVKK